MMMLSMPRTISRAVRVKKATQISGLVSHSMCIPSCDKCRTPGQGACCGCMKLLSYRLLNSGKIPMSSAASIMHRQTSTAHFKVKR
ncbi:hypothetical protein D3C76_1748860 [compost metagenome]